MAYLIDPIVSFHIYSLSMNQTFAVIRRSLLKLLCKFDLLHSVLINKKARRFAEPFVT